MKTLNWGPLRHCLPCPHPSVTSAAPVKMPSWNSYQNSSNYNNWRDPLWKSKQGRPLKRKWTRKIPGWLFRHCRTWWISFRSKCMRVREPMLKFVWISIWCTRCMTVAWIRRMTTTFNCSCRSSSLNLIINWIRRIWICSSNWLTSNHWCRSRNRFRMK